VSRPAAAPAASDGSVDVDLTRAWIVDPASGRDGPGEIVVRGGILEAVNWLEGDDATGVDASGVIVAPGFIDLHAHLREPGNEDAETVATGLAAAAHGGFTTVVAMPDTTPTLDSPGVLALIRAAGAASGSPVELLAYGAASVDRAGKTLAALGELADAGIVGFSDDGVAIHSATLFRNALAYAGALGLPIVEHPEDHTQTDGAEANEGDVATVLGLKSWPTAAEAAIIARNLAILAETVGDVPGARLHLAHVSTAASIELIRAAKAAGLPVTADATPHHLALTDEWVAGARRYAWEAGPDGDPWRDGALVVTPYATSLRVDPPLRTPADALAVLAALADGTIDAIATDHAPQTAVDKDVEFGDAAIGISGIETAIGLVLGAVDAGQLPLLRAIELLTAGPAAILGRRRGLVEGEPADLVVIDRSDAWTVTPDSLISKGKNSPLLGRSLPGRVLLTLASGRIAYEAPDAEG
jgi:dihydroorotase